MRKLVLSMTAALVAGVAMAEDLQIRIADARVEILAGKEVAFRSPIEGLWSVATDWKDGWPAEWAHAKVSGIEKVGEWTIMRGELKLPGGVMQVRDSYRLRNGLIQGVRRWTWTGKETLSKATLSVRWTVPGAVKAKPMMPGIVLYGNPAGESTGNHAVAVHRGNAGDKTFFEEHRFSALWTSLEWASQGGYQAAAMHTLPSSVYGGNQNDQWWSLGVTALEDGAELAALSGPVAANGKDSVAKAQQGKFMDYPDTWLNLRPETVVEKTFYLQPIGKTAKGSGFRPALEKAMELNPIALEGLPTYADTLKDKYRFAMSRFRDREKDPGFEMYPDWVQGTQYVMGWAGQSDAGGYGMLGLAKKLGEPGMIARGQRTLDWLATSPFNENGFMLNYNADNGVWKDQDPVSQGQAMEIFARSIVLGRKMPGVNVSKWEAFLKRACTLQASRILREDWKPRNTAEAFFVSPLCKAYSLFGDEAYKQAAVKAGEYYARRHLSMDEPYWGGTLDANCEDKEGAWAGFQAFLALYELTGSGKYLDWASHAMDVTLSYTVLWDIDLPAGRLRDAGFKTRGWTVVSAQNQHLDVFGVVYTPEIYRMGLLLGRSDLNRLAAAMYRSCGQMMDAWGSSGEQIQQTNFAQHGDMSDVFRLRGGYSESWTVFWITAHFLTAGSEFERMGVRLG